MHSTRDRASRCALMRKDGGLYLLLPISSRSTLQDAVGRYMKPGPRSATGLIGEFAVAVTVHVLRRMSPDLLEQRQCESTTRCCPRHRRSSLQDAPLARFRCMPLLCGRRMMRKVNFSSVRTECSKGCHNIGTRRERGKFD